MSPRVAKKDRGEPPTPMVKPGVIGVYPLRALGLSFVQTGLVDVVMGVKDAPETIQAKEKPTFLFQDGKAKQSIDLPGKIFNSFPDAFYRGNLPQVILVGGDTQSVFKMMDEFFDYLEKLYSLGFFIIKKNEPMASPIDPVDQYVPCFVIASNGIFFGTFLKKLSDSLNNIKQVNEASHRKILSKFCRGVMDPCDWQPLDKNVPIQLESARKIKIAGGSSITQNTIQYLMGARGFEVSVESQAENPIERLEFLNALTRTVKGFLPALNHDGKLSAAETAGYETKLQDAILTIGQKRKAFSHEETADRLLQSVQPVKGYSSQVNGKILPGDSAIVNSLIKYAEILQLEEQKKGLQTLIEKAF
jgi:hypothetical protein